MVLELIGKGGTGEPPVVLILLWVEYGLGEHAM